MNDEIKAAPLVFESFEQSIDRGVVGHITGEHVGPDLLRERRHALLEDIALVRKGQLGALTRCGLGNPPRYGLVVGHAHDQTALTGQNARAHVRFLP